jgi:hypothetical protein
MLVATLQSGSTDCRPIVSHDCNQPGSADCRCGEAVRGKVAMPLALRRTDNRPSQAILDGMPQAAESRCYPTFQAQPDLRASEDRRH